MKDIIYLDNAATTKPYNEIFDHINNYKDTNFGNPSSLYKIGLFAENELKKTRDIIAKNLYCKTSEIFFTSGGTESNNLAIQGYLKRNKHSGNRILTTKMEHPSIKNTFEVAKRDGYEVTYIKNDNYGTLDLDHLKKSIDNNTALISIMHVNNETGSINDIEKIGKIIKEKNKNTVFHVDAVQSFLKIDLNIEKSYIDLLSISAHKIHGLKGTGVLYKKDGILLEPLFYGGGQENDYRPGTENTIGIMALGIATEKHNNQYRNIQKVKIIKNLMINELLKIDNVYIISPENSSPFILSVAFPKIPSEIMVHHLESNNIYVSPGAACSSKKKDRSHVLLAMNLEEGLIDSTIRFSFCYTNNIDEIDFIIQKIKNSTNSLRKIYK